MLFVKNRCAQSLCLNISVFVYFGSWFLLMRQEIKAPPARKIINGLAPSDKFGRIHWSASNFSPRILIFHLDPRIRKIFEIPKQISKTTADSAHSLWRNCFGDCNQNILRTGNRLSVKIWDSLSVFLKNKKKNFTFVKTKHPSRAKPHMITKWSFMHIKETFYSLLKTFSILYARGWHEKELWDNDDKLIFTRSMHEAINFCKPTREEGKHQITEIFTYFTNILSSVVSSTFFS